MKTVYEIAALVGGTIHGEADREIHTVGSLHRAGEGALSYAEGKYLAQVGGSRASCILVPSADFPGRTVIVVEQPRVAFARVARLILPPERPFDGIHSSALIDPSARVADDVAVGAWTVIERGVRVDTRTVIFPGCFVGADCRIGADCVLHPGVVLYPSVTLGDGVVVHAGSVLGADGFGFVFDGTRQVKVPQVGHVAVDRDVEIGANACIDRGALDETVIGEGTKIDNLCQIAHNVRVGIHTVISSQTGVAGSSRIGDYATLGGQVGVADYCRVDDRAMVGAQCGIPSRKRVPAGEVYWGTPARPLRQIKRQQAHLGRLPDLADEVKRLRAEIEQLKARLDAPSDLTS